MSLRTRGFLMLAMLVTINACSQTQPVATSYKEEYANAQAAKGGDTGDLNKKDPKPDEKKPDDKTPKPAGTDLVAQGTAVWNAKCMGCHMALDKTDKKGAVGSAADVLALKTSQAAHASTVWPTGTDADAIYAVLK